MPLEKIKENRREQESIIENLSLSETMKKYKKEQDKEYNDITKQLHSIENSPDIAGGAMLSVLAISAGSIFVSGGLTLPIILGTAVGVGVTGLVGGLSIEDENLTVDKLKNQKEYLTRTMEREKELGNLELSPNFKEYRNNQNADYAKVGKSMKKKMDNLTDLSTLGLFAGTIAGFVGAVTVSAVSSVALPIAVGCLAVSGVSYLASKKVERKGVEELKEIEKTLYKNEKKFEEDFPKSDVAQKAEKYEPPKNNAQKETKRERVFFDLSQALENNAETVIKEKRRNTVGLSI